MDLQEREEKLKAKIKLAENSLIEKFENTSITDYIIPKEGVLSNWMGKVSNESINTIHSLDSVTQQIFPAEHKINKLTHYLSLGIRIYQSLVTNKS